MFQRWTSGVTPVTLKGLMRTLEVVSMTMMHTPVPETRVGPATPVGPADQRPEPPEHVVPWTDPVTGANGYLVVHRLVGDLATGGTRMRVGCTESEVADLARAMALKTAVFELPVGGAKGGIDFDPKDPRAIGVLERFYSAMQPWLDGHWVTAPDLGVPQSLLDDVFLRLGMDHSFHAAFLRSTDAQATLRRVQEGLHTVTEDGLLLAEVIGGYGVAQACLGAARALHWAPEATSVAIQGIGTMGGGAAWYLHEAGVRVVAVADAGGTLYRAGGLDIPALLALRDTFGEIDRSRIPDDVELRPRDAVLSTEADIFVPAAVSYAIREDNVDELTAHVIVEAANSATTPAAEALLAAQGVPVVPDVVANAGAATWAWWLLQGEVGTDPADSFTRLRNEMHAKVTIMLEQWQRTGTTPRLTSGVIADTNRRALAGARITVP